MKISTVTITGADDSINPEALIELSQEFPFVEWGILLSATQEGGKRFPSLDWMKRLDKLVLDHSLEESVNVSAHLCGGWVRDILKGIVFHPHDGIWPMFRRAQLNFHAETIPIVLRNCLSALKHLDRELIFQWDGVNNYLYAYARRAGIAVTPLFDLSGGAGVVPDEWPRPMENTWCGYAGGLGPENLQEELQKIAAVVGDRTIWIDTETKVRSNNDMQFDIGKVRTFLEIAKAYTGGTGPELRGQRDRSGW